MDRLSKHRIFSNSQMKASLIKKYCALDRGSLDFLEKVEERLAHVPVEKRHSRLVIYKECLSYLFKLRPLGLPTSGHRTTKLEHDSAIKKGWLLSNINSCYRLLEEDLHADIIRL